LGIDKNREVWYNGCRKEGDEKSGEGHDEKKRGATPDLGDSEKAGRSCVVKPSSAVAPT